MFWKIIRLNINGIVGGSNCDFIIKGLLLVIFFLKMLKIFLKIRYVLIILLFLNKGFLSYLIVSFDLVLG